MVGHLCVACLGSLVRLDPKSQHFFTVFQLFPESRRRNIVFSFDLGVFFYLGQFYLGQVQLRPIFACPFYLPPKMSR